MNKDITAKLKELNEMQRVAIKERDNETLRSVNTQIFNITEQLRRANRIRIEQERERRMALSIERKMSKENGK